MSCSTSDLFGSDTTFKWHINHSIVSHHHRRRLLLSSLQCSMPGFIREHSCCLSIFFAQTLRNFTHVPVNESDVFSTSDLLLFSSNMRSNRLSGWFSFVVCLSCKSTDKCERNIITVVVQVSSCRALTAKVSVLEAREAVAQDLVARRVRVPLVDRRVITVRTTMEVAFVKRNYFCRCFCSFAQLIVASPF